MKNLICSTWPILAIFLSAGCGAESSPPTTPTAIVSTLEATAGCATRSVGLTPLTDSGSASFPGVSLGLYPGGSNDLPGAHLSAGLQIAQGLTPIDANGVPAANGKYALISIGMSNTTQEFSAFIAMSPSPNRRLTLVDGAQGGQTAARWADPSCACWEELDARISGAGLTNAQVVAAWIKLANAQPQGTWPTATIKLQSDIEATVRLLSARFPKLQLAYLSSRIYAGYATTPLNPEPYAYQSAFAVRGVIESQLNGHLPFAGPSRVAPWLAWGPYLWADGMRARSDGLRWTCSDFESDGTHPSATGRQKVAQKLLEFFSSDPTTQEWFMATRIEWPWISTN
jgi:hypothetical protein